MKHIVGYRLRHLVWASLLGLLVACATGNEPPPIGGSPTAPESYPVDVERTSLSFAARPEVQTRNGIEARLDVSQSHPQRYYRYDVKSKDTGKYLVFMPNPPKMYTVYRIPFYKNDVDASVVKITLANHSPRVLDTSHAICAFDLDGQTVVSQPLKADVLLPGHVLAVPVNGPTLSQLKGHKEMTVWIYQIGTMEEPFKWTLPYALTVTASKEEAKLIGESPSESAVKRYEGLIEPATESAAPPDGQ